MESLDSHPLPLHLCICHITIIVKQSILITPLRLIALGPAQAIFRCVAIMELWLLWDMDVMSGSLVENVNQGGMRSQCPSQLFQPACFPDKGNLCKLITLRSSIHYGFEFVLWLCLWMPLSFFHSPQQCFGMGNDSDNIIDWIKFISCPSSWMSPGWQTDTECKNKKKAKTF